MTSLPRPLRVRTIEPTTFSMTFWMHSYARIKRGHTIVVQRFRWLKTGRAPIVASLHHRLTGRCKVQESESRQASGLKISPTGAEDMEILPYLLSAFARTKEVEAAYLVRIRFRGQASRLLVGVRTSRSQKSDLEPIVLALSREWIENETSCLPFDLFWMNAGNETLSEYVRTHFGPFYSHQNIVTPPDEEEGFWGAFDKCV
jgi:hypothetical protein